MVQEVVLSVMAWGTTLRSLLVGSIRPGVERGQGLMEYAILIGAIALVAGTFLVAGGGDTFGFNTFVAEVRNCVTLAANCGD